MQQWMQELLWGIVENFYAAFQLFNSQYQEYERRVKDFSKTKKIARENLNHHLSREEVVTLLDYDLLQKLRDEHLEPLQKMLDQMKQGVNPKNLLDDYVRDIFYETAVLKDACHKLKVSAPQYRELSDEEEYKVILEEVHTFFPVKMKHLFHLFRKARRELEKLIAHYHDSTILVRCLYLFGEQLISPVYEEGMRFFWQAIYPDYNVLELFTRAAFSFHKSGFTDLAHEAADKAQQFLDAQHEIEFPLEWRNMLEQIMTH
jgi:hypothetical protein